MKILVACEESQVVVEAFISAGHDAMSCDLLPGAKGLPHYRGDVREVLYHNWDMIIAFPPCTDLSVSGARWFKDKDQQPAIDFFMLFANHPCKKVAIENPIGIMSTRYRKPDQIIQPWWFGHPETKSTCLWLNGLKPLEKTNVVEPDFMKKANGEYYKDAKGKRYSRIHFMSRNNKDRAKLRSKTFPGIAKAMAEQWS